MNLRRILNGVADILYPPCCPICGKIENTGNACIDCRNILPYVSSARCLKCGKELESGNGEYCADCIKKKHLFEYGVAVFSYDDAVKTSMYNFKYKNRRVYASYYAWEIKRIYGNVIAHMGVDVIVPVPMYEFKKKVRGYNQAELIATELSVLTGIPSDASYLMRTRDTVPQKELSDEGRVANVKNAFQIQDNGVKYKKVLLVDDIYTTGITMDECTRVLKERGVQEVYFVTVCIGRGF